MLIPRCHVCAPMGYRPGCHCPNCEIPLDPPPPSRWRMKLAELLPAERIAAAAIRGSISIAGFTVGEPMAAGIDPLLGKLAHTASVLFGMLALWGLLLPIESAIVEPVARRLVGKRAPDDSRSN